MVTLTIDQKHIQVAEGTTILEAAEQNGIPIPRLCYLKEINEIGACRICCVEVEGKEKLITSCNNLVEDGMVIYTNSPKVRMNRRNMIELILPLDLQQIQIRFLPARNPPHNSML